MLELTDNTYESCKAKEKLAMAVNYARVPMDGSIVENTLTLTERNWFTPERYYIAVLDCDD